MKKSGQLQVSFGIIFSIIIIVATLAVAAYVITKFWNSGRDIDCKLFQNELQMKVDKIWASDGSVSDIFTGNAPSKASQVCFGNASQQLIGNTDDSVYVELKKYARSGDNLFFYPRSSCGSGKSLLVLKHVNTAGFFCVPVVSGKASVKLYKGEFDALVKLTE